jgi:hypothetical protein
MGEVISFRRKRSRQEIDRWLQHCANYLTTDEEWRTALAIAEHFGVTTTNMGRLVEVSGRPPEQVAHFVASYFFLIGDDGLCFRGNPFVEAISKK